MRLGYIAATIVLAVVGGIYWFILDGSTPSRANYEFPISEMRALIDAEQAPLPNFVRYEVVSERKAPKLVMHAGLNFSNIDMAMTSFQISGPATNIIIESAIAKPPTGSADSGGRRFYDDAYGRMSVALAQADAVIVTHEHFDHIEGIARHPNPALVATRLLLSAAQIAALPASSNDGTLADAYRRLQPADLSKPRLIAPGVAIAPARGHTPGSQVILVRKDDGVEMLFVGDIVWTMSNVTQAWGRPRLLQTIFFSTPEDRALVQRQVRALHELQKAEPALVILPTHDLPYIRSLSEQGVITDIFVERQRD